MRESIPLDGQLLAQLYKLTQNYDLTREVREAINNIHDTVVENREWFSHVGFHFSTEPRRFNFIVVLRGRGGQHFAWTSNVYFDK